MHVRTQSGAFLLLLGALAALPSLGIDMNLPALASIGASLGVGANQAGLTMSLFMLGFAIGPLIAGPVSDWAGRRPVALAAIVTFIAANAGCSAATSLPSLLAWRVLAGSGAGAAMVSAFGIIRDHFEGHAGQTKMSYVTSIMLVSPMLAPAGGTLLMQPFGWRGIFIALVVIGLGLLYLVWSFLPEKAQARRVKPLTPGSVIAAYAEVLTHPQCLGYILINAAAFGALFAYVSGSSLFFIGALALSPLEYSLIFALTSFAIMAGAFVSGRLGQHIAPETLLGAGVLLAFGSSIAAVVASAAGWTNLPGMVAVFAIASFSFGLIAPNAGHAALQPLPDRAGIVSAVAGSIQVLVGSLSSVYVVAWVGCRPALSMAFAMAVCSTAATATYLYNAKVRTSAVRTSSRNRVIRLLSVFNRDTSPIAGGSGLHQTELDTAAVEV